jgi:hypothetical protein
MANKNFIVKNGLEVGGQEVVSSSGVVTSAALGGQTLASTDSPTFNNLTLTNDIAVGGDINLTGDLNITGDVNTLSVTDLDVTDQTITLGKGQVESASGGSGIVIDGSGASILWDETNDTFDMNKGLNVDSDTFVVDNTNNSLEVSYNGGDFLPITITAGRLTFKEIANVLKQNLNSSIPGASGSFNVIPTNNTFYYTISANNNFTINFTDGSKKLLGFSQDSISGSLTYTSDKHPDQTKHFVDLVIPEIPDIACKMGSKKQMIDRIPLNSETGSLVYYRSPEAELQTHNYFYPMKLSSLNIQLYENDSNTPYNSDVHNYFEFEITIVKNTELFK